MNGKRKPRNKDRGRVVVRGNQVSAWVFKLQLLSTL